MGVNITTIDYLRVSIIEFGSTIILMVVFQPRVTMVKNSVQMVTVDSNLSPSGRSCHVNTIQVFLLLAVSFSNTTPGNQGKNSQQKKHILTLVFFHGNKHHGNNPKKITKKNTSPRFLFVSSIKRSKASFTRWKRRFASSCPWGVGRLKHPECCLQWYGYMLRKSSEAVDNS